MKDVKLTIIFILSALMSLPVAARSVRDFFASEPDVVFTLLPKDRRLDMLDYYDAGQKMPVGNNFGGTALLDTLTSDFMRIQTSGSSRVELFMATSKRDTVLYVVSTCLLPAADSYVAVYDTNWNELPVDKYLKQLRLGDFIVIPKGEKIKCEDLAAMAKFPTIEYSVVPDDKSIVARHTVKGIMTVERYDEIKPYLVDSLVYNLKGVKFGSVKK